MKPLLAGLHAALGSEVSRTVPVGGGDINDAFHVTLADGREVFVKTHARAPRGMYETEARGLRWLAEAGALRVPEVLAVSDGGEGPAFLALSYLAPGRRGAGFDEELGRGLAALHRYGAPGFGLDHDNFIGRLPQDNATEPTWAAFYGEHRILPMVRRAASGGLLDGGLCRQLDRLVDALPSLVGPDEPPARLHGDLWGGNLHTDPEGHPCLIDPAVYGGHREIDLAMMRLFGGFGPRVFDAYMEASPLAPGHEDRVPLYQLFPLLVHVNLFGSGYVGAVRAALRRLL